MVMVTSSSNLRLGCKIGTWIFRFGLLQWKPYLHRKGLGVRTTRAELPDCAYHHRLRSFINNDVNLPIMISIFRWLKFTLKPPNSITHENLLVAIWDTSHWNFFVKFGLKTAWHISYDILWSLLTYVNFWQLQGHLSTFAKIRGPQKIKVFSMKERSVVNEAWGVLGGQITGLHDGIIFLGVWHT